LNSPSDALRLGIGMLHQDPHDFPSMTIREDLQIWDSRTGVKKSASDWQQLIAIQKDLGFHFDQNGTVGELTVGERQQLELVRLLWLGVEVLILDEPTTASSQPTGRLFAALKKLPARIKPSFSFRINGRSKELCSLRWSCASAAYR
jgi:simple sugar transport system ATP-binding protein